MGAIMVITCYHVTVILNTAHDNLLKSAIFIGSHPLYLLEPKPPVRVSSKMDQKLLKKWPQVITGQVFAFTFGLRQIF